MILKINEVENLIKMLKSPDYENKVLAYKVIDNLDFEKSIGEIMLMYRLGDYSLENWEQYSKLAHDFIMDKIENYNGDTSTTMISTGEMLSLMLINNASKDSIDLFLKYFTEEMTKTLKSMHYPMDKIDFNIKLKEDGQTTESK
jgi:hypothetical protein